MRDLSENLERLERELRATAVDDTGRWSELLRERARLIKILTGCAVGLPAEMEAYEILRAHRVVGEELAVRLREERAQLVEAWGESVRERQLMHLLEAARNAEVPQLAEIG